MESKKKTQPKPKVRYFKMEQGDDYLEIITTSFTNIILKSTLTMNEALNYIIYSKLPNSLQPTDCHREIILTLNPVVSMYEECKNTLAITNCRKLPTTAPENEEDEERIEASPIKEELNDTARKQLEFSEKKKEEYSLKLKRQEEDIVFYRKKFG
jgi:hypothetical protein